MRSARIQPEMYGDALEYFYFTLLCPYLDTTYTPHLKIGAYRPLQRSFYCDLYFAKDFGDRDRNNQKVFFVENLASAINALELKFRKKRMNFDITRFRSDVESACEVSIERLRKRSSSRFNLEAQSDVAFEPPIRPMMIGICF